MASISRGGKPPKKKSWRRKMREIRKRNMKNVWKSLAFCTLRWGISKAPPESTWENNCLIFINSFRIRSFIFSLSLFSFSVQKLISRIVVYYGKEIKERGVSGQKPCLAGAKGEYKRKFLRRLDMSSGEEYLLGDGTWTWKPNVLWFDYGGQLCESERNLLASRHTFFPPLEAIIFQISFENSLPFLF